MEYASREQAQNAVNTLSNQNLMGRLVYVREVRIQDWVYEPRLIEWTRARLTLLTICRIVKPSLALPGPRRAAISGVVVEVGLDTEVPVDPPVQVVPVAVKSTCRTFVSHSTELLR